MSIQKIQLVCLPFAGGTQYAFQALKGHLHPGVELVGVDYAGHGMRMREPLIRDLDGFLEDVMEQVVPHVNGAYALFGHSLGALVGYLVCLRLREQGRNLPVHVFVSGRNGPGWVDPDRAAVHLLPHGEFIAKLRELGGSPEEVLQNEELMRLFVPMLRADFEVAHGYVHQEAAPLEVPMTVMAGRGEKEASEEALGLWRVCSSFPVKVEWFEGGHFFLFEHWAEIGALINRKLGLNIGTGTWS